MNIRDQMRAWVETATINIRFKPDREAVARELQEHIEDRYLDIRRIFPSMTEEEALARTMNGMGDQMAGLSVAVQSGHVGTCRICELRQCNVLRRVF